MDNERRNKLKDFIFIQNHVSAPLYIEFFVGSSEAIDVINVFDCYNIGVGVAVERNSKGFYVIKWNFLTDLYFLWNI